MAEEKTSILVVGATGKQGGRAIEVLLSDSLYPSKLSLRFITRNPDSASAQKLVARGAQAVKADLLDAASLEAALDNVQRAFLVTDAGAGEKEADQGKIFIDAAKKKGVKHIVFSSVGSAKEAAHMVPHFATKYEVEKHLEGSGLGYTILRPVAFMDNFPAAPGVGRFMMVGMFYSWIGFKKCQLVATEDIGVFAGKALLAPEDPAFKNKTITLSGGNYGIEDIRKAFQEAQGGSAPWFASYAPKITRRLLPYDPRQMFIYFDQVGYEDVDVAALRKIHPGLLSFEDWVKQKSK